MEVLGGCLGFQTEDLEDRAILDVMDDLFWPKGRYPESFGLISLLEVCQEWGILHGVTGWTLRVSDRILGWPNHLWCHGLPCLTPRKIPWKFCINIFIRIVSRRGVHHEGTWRTLRVPDRRLGWQGHPWCNGWPFLTQRKIP